MSNDADTSNDTDMSLDTPEPRGRKRSGTRNRGQSARVRFRDVQSRAKLHVDLSTSEKKEFQYRWVNDDGTRIQELASRGYELVDNTDNDEHGGNERRVGVKQNGQRMNARLMRLPMRFHDEDVEDRRQLRHQQRESMQRVDKDPQGGVVTDNQHSRMTEHQLTIS